MSEPSEAAFERASALAASEPSYSVTQTARDYRNAFARFIQEVSDAVKAVRDETSPIGLGIPSCLAPFILPEPVDPLDAVFDALPHGIQGCVDASARFRRELAKRGLQIVEVGK